MLRKSMMIAACFALAFGIALYNADNSSANNAGPEEMTLKTAAGKKPASFPHKKHQDQFECAACHHTKTDDGKQGPYVAGEEKKCETCHNSDMPNEALNEFKKVAHAVCKECHKKMAAEGKNAPTKCTGCHVKE